MESECEGGENSTRDLPISKEGEVLRNDGEEGKVLRNFIEGYEGLPVLWNSTHPNYSNKAKRNAALDELASIYIKIKPGATRVDVKRKINTLRCDYRKELKKILASKRSGAGADDVYQPTSCVFYALQFLDKFEQPANLNIQQLEPSPVDDGTSGEAMQHPLTSASPAASRSSILPVLSPPQPITKKARVLGPIARQNELLQKACSYLEDSTKPQKDIPTIAKAWGEKLETLDPQQRPFAEKAINDILFETSQGTLHRHSVRINEDSPYQKSPSLDSSHSFIHLLRQSIHRVTPH